MNENFFKISQSHYEIIPLNVLPSKFYSISFEGWRSLKLDANDENFIRVMSIAAKTIETFIEMYSKTHAFTQPEFSYTIKEQKIILNIGTLELEKYDLIMKEMKRPQDKCGDGHFTT